MKTKTLLLLGAAGFAYWYFNKQKQQQAVKPMQARAVSANRVLPTTMAGTVFY